MSQTLNAKSCCHYFLTNIRQHNNSRLAKASKCLVCELTGQQTLKAFWLKCT